MLAVVELASLVAVEVAVDVEAVVLVVLAIVFFFAVDPMLGIFTVLLAQFSLKLEDRNE